MGDFLQNFLKCYLNPTNLRAITNSGQGADQLVKLFKLGTEKSLAESIALMSAQGLYVRALSKIEQGQDISDELPELKTISTTNAIRIIYNLIADANERVESAWALDAHYDDLLKTSFRMKQLPGELFSVFDVEYKITASECVVVISAVSNRRMMTGGRGLRQPSNVWRGSL